MAAIATYRQFLASPSASLLAPSASLYYITTGVVVGGGPDEIIKHFSSLRREVKKKKEDVLSVIDGQAALAAEIDTELELTMSGGAYLPGMDNNFLSDRTVYFLVMHMVAFNPDGKIVQIRLSWDQGALLKQLDIIGKTGRNWPIRDSREQLSAIASCVRAIGGNKTGVPTNGSNGNSNSNSNNNNNNNDSIAAHQARGSSANTHSSIAGDQTPERAVSPYAGTRPQQRSFTDILGDQPEDAPAPAMVSPYAGARPQQRSFEEILGDEEEKPECESPSGRRTRTASSASKDGAVAPKSGSGKNFQPSRLFEGKEHVAEEDEDEKEDPAKASQKFRRPNPTKYDHFDFADGTDPQDAPMPGVSLDRRPRGKHDSNWSFDDFMTPHKPKPSKAFHHQEAREARHWDPEPGSIPETPANQRPAPPKPRPDADAHFEMQDDGADEGAAARAAAAGKSRGLVHNERLRLYDTKVPNQEGGAATPDGPGGALGNITNLKDRRKDFDAHFAMLDESPAAKENRARNSTAVAKGSDERGINIAGDGMGGRKGTDRGWMYGGEESREKKKEGITTTGDGMGGRKGADRNWIYGGQSEKEGINIAGDGMGGRKGADRSWMYGDETNPAPAGVPGRKPGGAVATSKSSSSSFSWDI